MTPPERPALVSDEQVLERVVFFSDAVFAIAITLLALDLRFPDHVEATNQGVIDALLALRPQLAAFALSFAVIAAFWIGHVRTMRAIDRTDSRFVVLNVVFLAAIALLPFPTSVVARQGDVPAGAIFYAVFALVTATLSSSLWVYAWRGGLMSARIPDRIERLVTYRAVIVPALFAVSIPVALVSPAAAWVLWTLIFPAQILLVRRFGIEREMEASLAARREST